MSLSKVFLYLYFLNIFRMGETYIPNDISLGTNDSPENVILITGPNMGGKSTLLRAVSF